jgi:hypothetical protein
LLGFENLANWNIRELKTTVQYYRRFVSGYISVLSVILLEINFLHYKIKPDLELKMISFF